ncbi:MAG: MOSC domain-containing protein, partial [Deltaproteobacteria bacterium]
MGTPQPQIVAVSRSASRGVKKQNIAQGRLISNHGLEGDAHAGNWSRQVSLLAQENIDQVRQRGLEVGPGDFAENLTTRGLELIKLPIGSRLRIG